jgi:hypothetical protein
LTTLGSLLDCRGAAGTPVVEHRHREIGLGFFDAGSRRKVAVVVTSDGRRVHVPIDPTPFDVSLLALLRSIPGLDGLLGLISGSRRDRGTRSGTRD